MRVLGLLEPEHARLEEWVSAGATVADVGANYGSYTYPLSRQAGRVVAFEPIPECANALRAWGATNVDVVEAAISDREGSATLTIPEIDGAEKLTQGSLEVAGSGRDITVRTATLDSCHFSDLSFVKIDVEGHELAVIRGAGDTLRRCRPLLLIEIAQRLLVDVTVADVVSAIEDLGYDGVLLAPGAEVPAVDFVQELHQPLVNGRRGEGYANMFLFRPRGATR